MQGQTKAVQEPGVLTAAQKHSACFGQDSESLTAPLRGRAGTGTWGWGSPGPTAAGFCPGWCLVGSQGQAGTQGRTQAAVPCHLSGLPLRKNLGSGSDLWVRLGTVPGEQGRVQWGACEQTT